jgi:hypothetical protein
MGIVEVHPSRRRKELRTSIQKQQDPRKRGSFCLLEEFLSEETHEVVKASRVSVRLEGLEPPTF